MLNLRCSPASFTGRLSVVEFSRNRSNSLNIVCATKGPRPRYPRVWKSKKRIGTISKSLKLVERVKELSNVKEQVYGDLDTFIAWELEFPLITVKKALKILEGEKEWKRIIQVTKWMLSKGQGRTMGSYYTLLNALAEDERIEEAEELWKKLFSENLESTPRTFFEKMVKIYYQKEMHDQIFEIFADMEELGQRPTPAIVSMVGDVFQKLGMLDKYEKLNKKYAPPRWEYRYFKGKRVKVRAKSTYESERNKAYVDKYREETDTEKSDLNENEEVNPDELKDEVDQIRSEHSNESESDSNEMEILSEKNGEDSNSYVLEDEVDRLSDSISEDLSPENVEESSDLLEDVDRKSPE